MRQSTFAATLILRCLLSECEQRHCSVHRKREQLAKLTIDRARHNSRRNTRATGNAKTLRQADSSHFALAPRTDNIISLQDTHCGVCKRSDYLCPTPSSSSIPCEPGRDATVDDDDKSETIARVNGRLSLGFERCELNNVNNNYGRE